MSRQESSRAPDFRVRSRTCLAMVTMAFRNRASALRRHPFPDPEVEEEISEALMTL